VAMAYEGWSTGGTGAEGAVVEKVVASVAMACGD